jgi:hypothetical protein
MGIAYVYRDANGNKKYRRCIPENMIYGYSDRDDFADSKIQGELSKMKISDAREYYPKINEKQWFEIWKTTQQNSVVRLDWTDDFVMMVSRPYDDAQVELFTFAVITNEQNYWVKSEDNRGRTTLDKKKSYPDTSASKRPAEIIEKKLKVVYEGCYAPGPKIILHWELMENMIKPHHALHEVFGPYAIVMPNNKEMRNISMANRTKSSVRQLCLLHLKIQQIVAKMRPDGYKVDISGIQNINLTGDPDGAMASPLELQSIADQTGVIYFNSTTEESEIPRKDAPIQPAEVSQSMHKINALIQTYNFYLQRLRDDLGTNEYVEGQAVNPKTGKGVMENQVAMSNRATNFVYDAYINLLEQVAKRFAVMEWYDVAEGKRQDSYGLAPDSIVDSVFDLKISLLPTSDELNYVRAITEKALTAGLITFEEAFKIRRIAKENVKLAEIYLAKYEKRRKRQEQEANAANVQANQQAQMASNQQTHDNAMELEGKSTEGKIEVQKTANESDKNKFIQSLILEYAKLGIPVPDIYAPLVQMYLQNVAGAQGLQNVDNNLKMQNIEAAMSQEQQAQ